MFYFPSELLHLFFSSNSVVFVDRRRNNISCPRAQGTLATPLAACYRFYSTTTQVACAVVTVIPTLNSIHNASWNDVIYDI